MKGKPIIIIDKYSQASSLILPSAPRKKNETRGTSVTDAKVDYYPRVNKGAEVETIYTDKDDERKQMK